MTTTAEQNVVGMLEAFNERRFADFAAAYSSDATIRYPQSGETFAGRESILAMLEAFPAPPHFSVSQVQAAGDTVIVHADADYGEGPPWKAVLVYTLIDGLVATETAYFAAPFEAPDWRAPFRR